MHGLESGPGGTKHRVLAALPAVERADCPAMDTRRAPWSNRFVSAAAVAAAAGIGGAAAAATLLAAPAAAAAALVSVACVAVGAGGAILCLRRALRDIVDRGVAVQTGVIRAAAAAGRPYDVVVASSFGAAVAGRCIETGVWCGPTLLLAPAGARVARLAGTPAPDLLRHAQGHVNVVHGMHDVTVPLADSAALVGTRHCLLVVDDDHRLRESFQRNAAQWVLDTAAARVL